MRRLLVPVLLVAALPASAAAFTNPQIPGLQVALRAHGYDTGAVDGIVGPRTAAAVRAFQRRHGIHADGLAGPQTRTKLGRLGRPLFGARTLTPGRIGWDVSVLQFLLTQRGFAPTHLNGNFGRGTERAVRRFQRAYGLAVDGIAGAATQRALLSGHRVARRRRTPAARRYVVRPGDTLTAIARRYGTTVRALERANRLRRGAFIVIGMRLRITGGDSHVTVTGVGLAAARRALRAEGAVELSRPPVVVELTPEPSIAAGPAEHGLGEVLGAETVRADGIPADRQLVLVLRDAHRHEWERAAAEQLLAAAPDAVVVETGLPFWRPDGGAGWIATHGQGRANLEAAAELLRGR